MDKEGVVLLNAVAGLKRNLSDVKGDVDMCKAWEDYAKERGKEKETRMLKSLIRSGIPYDVLKKSLQEVAEEELKQLYEEAEKDMAVL